MMKFKLLLTVSLLLAVAAAIPSTGFSQLSIEQQKAQSVSEITPKIVTRLIAEDGSLIGTETESTGPTETSPGEPAVVLRLKTERPIGQLLVKLKSKTVVPVKVAEGVYRVDVPGTHEIEVNAIGQNPLSWDDETISVTIEDPQPPLPTPDGDSLSSKITRAVQRVDPVFRKDAKLMASAFQSVASRAAGLAHMDAKGMIAATSERIKRDFNDRQLAAWHPWQVEYSKIYKTLNLGTDKGKHIQAWNEIADGLNAVRQ